MALAEDQLRAIETDLSVKKEEVETSSSNLKLSRKENRMGAVVKAPRASNE